MLTRERFAADLERSRQLEKTTYKELTLGLYRGLQAPLKALYDQMVSATGNLTAITARSLQDHPQIIKVLRYCLAPVISQMRLGQIIGITSTGPFEKDGTKPGPQQAADLVRWFENYLDRERFAWTGPTPPPWSVAERQIAEHYAKLCTVALVSNQNTATQYRMKRQKMQEDAIAAALVAGGLTLQARVGPVPSATGRKKKGEGPARRPRKGPAGVSSADDVQPSHFVRAATVLAGLERNQSADLTVRPGPAPKLFCIEAKAVGIRIDSAKRLKELNDKYTDWQAVKPKLDLVTLGVCAGFFNLIELIATIRVRGIPMFFEHDLAPLADFLQTGNYFGSPWEPKALFTEVPAEALREALDKITSAEPDVEERGAAEGEIAGE